MAAFVYQAVLVQEPDGAYSVFVPDLPGCVTCGDTYREAVDMAADALRTYVASLLKHGESIPAPTFSQDCGEGRAVFIYFETDAGYIVEGETISAAEAARRLHVSAGRVTHLLDAGLLEGYRRGRRTYITVESVEQRLASRPHAGRPSGASRIEHDAHAQGVQAVGRS